MEKMKLRVEHAPERCDICHQTDFFDSNKGSCSRCSDLVKPYADGVEFNGKRSSVGFMAQEQHSPDFILLEFIKQNNLAAHLLFSLPMLLIGPLLFVITYMFGTIAGLPLATVSIIFFLYMAKALRGIKSKMKQCKRCSKSNAANNNHCFNCGSSLPVTQVS